MTYAKKASPHAEMSDEDTSQPIIAGFEIKKVVREYVTIRGGGASTFGELLDANLKIMALNGDEVQTVSLEVNPDAWNEYSQAIRDNHAKAPARSY